MARYIYQGTFKDGNGNVVGSSTTSDGNAGTVSVYLAGGSTAADVYTASAGGTAVNSVSTDAYGHFTFWVDDGDYGSSQLFKITLSHADVESKTYDNIKIVPHSVTHIASDGSDHTFIDQDVTSGSAPTFDGTNFTNIPYSGIKSADRTGDDTDVVTGTAGDANDFLMWNSDGDAVGSGLASSEIDYSFVSGNDGSTGITAAELEELSDGSETTLHSHSPNTWTYGSQTATTSGTTVELTSSIPSDAVEIEVMLSAVGIDAANQHPCVEFGDGGGYETSGYLSYVQKDTGAAGAEQANTGKFHTTFNADTDADDTVSGVFRFIRWDTSEHLWFGTGTFYNSDGRVYAFVGTKTMSGALTSIRLNTVSETDNFDAGEARVRYR